ncbi:unnamed protein product [Trichobilharzia regenti]|nr:unnamed protein product [Trichobilharzia regenti]
MSGRGNGGKSGEKVKTRSAHAGLQFPVGRVHRLLRNGNYAERVGAGASVHYSSIHSFIHQLIEYHMSPFQMVFLFDDDEYELMNNSTPSNDSISSEQ